MPTVFKENARSFRATPNWSLQHFCVFFVCFLLFFGRDPCTEKKKKREKKEKRTEEKKKKNEMKDVLSSPWSNSSIKGVSSQQKFNTALKVVIHLVLPENPCSEGAPRGSILVDSDTP